MRIAEESTETEIEITWREPPSGEWTATLKNPVTGDQRTARTLEEFEQALLLLCQGAHQPA
jgi:hypothetical protein